MSDNPTKYEVLIEQYFRSILDISVENGYRRLKFLKIGSQTGLTVYMYEKWNYLFYSYLVPALLCVYISSSYKFSILKASNLPFEIWITSCFKENIDATTKVLVQY